MANVILENRTRRPRRMLVLNLPREIAPVRSVVRTRVESKDGIRRIKVMDRNVGGSLRIPFGKVSQPVPEKYLHAPDVSKVVKAREVRVIREDDPRWAKALEAADPKRARNAAREAVRVRARKAKDAELAAGLKAAGTASETTADGGPKTRRRK